MFAELIEWAMNLDREFAFLLSLPFAVALAGFVAEAVGAALERARRHRPQRPVTAPHDRRMESRHVARCPTARAQDLDAVRA